MAASIFFVFFIAFFLLDYMPNIASEQINMLAAAIKDSV